MDALIAARFYRISRPQNRRQRDFSQILEQFSNVAHSQREREISPGVTVRLERYTPRGDFVYSEFSRIQRVNVPPYTNPDGLAPIPLLDGQGIGHVCAFQYHAPTRIILLQRNMIGVTPARLSLYLPSLNAGSIFNLSPIIRRDGLARIANGDVRQITVSFAEPDDLAILEEEGVSGMRAARDLARTYNAPQIDITLTVGRSRTSHLDNRQSRSLMRRLLHGDISLNRLTTKIALPDGVEPVDLLEEALVVRDELQLTEGNHDRNYQERRNFLELGFRHNLAYLTEHYGNIDAD